jgi:thiosulfate/3-mercaptopyruvate sulfurtransferase
MLSKNPFLPQDPTQVREESSAAIASHYQGTFDLKKIPENTVFVDARTAFEYGLGHLQGSVNIQWQDFAQADEPYRGLLLPDAVAMARRLALYGIDPDTPVIVLGKGILSDESPDSKQMHSRASEGRVAWMLRYLGVKNVTWSQLDFFHGKMVQGEMEPVKNKEYWMPELQTDLLVSQEALLQDAKIAKTETDAVILIDVRSEKEYLDKNSLNKFSNVPLTEAGVNAANPPEPTKINFDTINVPWVEFFDEQGHVNSSIEKRLVSVGIRKDQKIYVLSNQGVRSAWITLMLRNLGFTKASNFAGGYKLLLKAAK